VANANASDAGNNQTTQRAPRPDVIVWSPTKASPRSAAAPCRRENVTLDDTNRAKPPPPTARKRADRTAKAPGQVAASPADL
jgi:hypothetical protein